MATISCSEWGGGGTEAAIFIWPLFWWAKAGNSSVASFLVLGGGGQVPDIKKYHIHVHVTYMHERAKRASASETYRPIFSHTTVSDKTLTLRKFMNKSSELGKFSPFSHSKTAISFNILLILLILYLRNIYIFRSQITSSIHIQSMQFPVITYGMCVVYKRQLYRQNTNIAKIYVYASERSERA